MPKKALAFLASLLGLIVVVFLINLFALKLPVSNRLAEDERNEDVEMTVRYAFYVNPSTLVVSISNCSNNSPADLLRAFLQTAEALQSRSYSTVELHKGYDHRFSLEGDYFQELGDEYDFQNPVYTMRTLPEELVTPAGEQAFTSFGGGLSGVSDQMENFNDFALQWCE